MTEKTEENSNQTPTKGETPKTEPRTRGKAKRLARASQKGAQMLDGMAASLTEISHGLGTIALRMQYAAQEVRGELAHAGVEGGDSEKGN